MTKQPGNPASTSERAALRQAIAERGAAKVKARATSEAAELGKQLLRAAETKLAAFGNVDDAILRHRAASYKSAAQGGPKPSLALPDELVRRERARDEAAAGVAAAKAAHGSLVGEFAEAQSDLRKAESKVTEMASSVLVAETTEQGLALGDQWSQFWATVDSLKGLASSGVRLPAEVVRALTSFDAMDHRQHPGGLNPRLARALLYWKTYRQALTLSADATEPDPKNPISGDLPSAADRAA